MKILRIRFYGQLRELCGESIEFDICSDRNSITLTQLLLKLRSKCKEASSIVTDDGKVRPGYLVFIDGVDYLVLGGDKAEVSCNSTVDIVPYVHGG